MEVQNRKTLDCDNNYESSWMKTFEIEIVSSDGRVSPDGIRLTSGYGRKKPLTERPCLASVVKCPEADRVGVPLVRGGEG